MPSVTALIDWLLMLLGRELGEKQRRKKSALSSRLLMLQKEKQRRKKSARSDWLHMLHGREPDEKQRRKKSALSGWLRMLSAREPGETLLDLQGDFVNDETICDWASVFAKVLWVKSTLNYRPIGEWLSIFTKIYFGLLSTLQNIYPFVIGHLQLPKYYEVLSTL